MLSPIPEPKARIRGDSCPAIVESPIQLSYLRMFVHLSDAVNFQMICIQPTARGIRNGPMSGSDARSVTTRIFAFGCHNLVARIIHDPPLSRPDHPAPGPWEAGGFRRLQGSHALQLRGHLLHAPDRVKAFPRLLRKYKAVRCPTTALPESVFIQALRLQ